MNQIDIDEVRTYVNEHIEDFHQKKIGALQHMQLSALLKKNPYLYRANDIITAGRLVEALLEAFLSSSEEQHFGGFLEGLANHVAKIANGGHKSSSQGIDLEFFNRSIHYLVSIKSGPNWGNSSQHKQQADDLREATARLKQLNRGANVQPVLGICYGKTRTSYVRGYLKVVGQNFWYLISENKDLYTDIVEPIGYRATEHNEAFHQERVRALNRLTKEMLDDYCLPDGMLDWAKVVQFNSGNYDLNKFLP